MRDSWQAQWSQSASKLRSVKPTVVKWIRQAGFTRKDEVVYNRLRAGHTHLTHSYLMDSSIQGVVPECELCHNATMTIQHVLVECPALDRVRREILGEPRSLDKMLGRTVPQRVLRFVREIGLYPRI